MAHDVFISYAKNDKPVADAVCAGLEAAGIRCWIAPRDIVPGTSWPRAIPPAISNSRVMVLIFSGHANASDNVIREVTLAAKANIPIIPLRIELVEPVGGLAFFLCMPHWLDALDEPLAAHIQRLCEVVAKLLPAKAPQPFHRAAASGAESASTPSVTDTRARLSLNTDPPGAAVPVNTALIPGLGATKINPIDGAEMVYVPAGEFTMGANDLRNAPEHRVYLDKYWIYKAPVTVAQYKASCAATKREMPDAPNWGWISDHPVVKVTWADATAYCEWAGVRLPTEAQWEKASRGTDARAFPWGNRWDGSRCANSAGRNNLSSTKPVRSYALGVSPCGALDMAGNVWEWCADWYGDYEARDLVRNPAGPKSGGARLLRGGAWSHAHGVNFRCAYRYFSEPTGRDGDDGFRCAGTELHFSH